MLTLYAGRALPGIRKVSTILLALLLVCGAAVTRAGAATVNADGFEGIDSMAWTPIEGSTLKQYTDAEGGRLYLLPNSPYTPTINKRAAVDGSQSMCVSVGVAGTHNTQSDRGEVQIAGAGGGSVKVGNEYWYSLNVRPDPGLKPNPVDPSRGTRVTDVVFQLHNTQSPALSGPPLVLQTDGLTWGMNVRGSRDPAAGYNSDGQSFPLGPVHLGAWTNFILDVKFNTDGQGWLRVWENGTLMFNKQVSNTYPDASSTSHGAFAKFGVYSWWLLPTYPFQQMALDEGNTSRSYCHDRIRVGDAGSSCQSLAPAGVRCDAVPATFGYQWNGSAPINAGPPDTNAGTTAFYRPIGVTATDSIDGQPPTSATDDDPSTYWSSSVSGAYLQLDLGAVKTVSKVYVGWLHGDRRQQAFRILAGDGTNTYDTGRLTSSGTSADLEAYGVPFNARYVRVYGYGNTESAYNSITEVKVSG